MNSDRDRGTAHPVAKPRGIEALTWLGGYFHSLRWKGKAYARANRFAWRQE
jgi:hypothetical protein